MLVYRPLPSPQGFGGRVTSDISVYSRSSVGTGHSLSLAERRGRLALLARSGFLIPAMRLRLYINLQNQVDWLLKWDQD